MQNVNELYNAEIEEILYEYCQEIGVDNGAQLTQSQFNGFLQLTGIRLFKNTNKLIRRSDERGAIIEINYNALDNLLTFYEQLCFRCNKCVSVFGFSRLAHIDEEVLQLWKVPLRNETLNSSRYSLWNRLVNLSEETLTNRLQDNKSNALGIIAILNHQHNWSAQDVAKEEIYRQTASLHDIKKRLALKYAKDETQ